MQIILAALALLATLLAVPLAYGQELEPRAYTNLPIGLNFLVMGYAESQGSLSTDPALPIEDAKLKMHTALFAYARSLDLWGRSGKFDVILPYSRLSGNAQFAGAPIEREVSGYSDPRFRLSMNFYGAPALAMPEYRSYEQDLVIGASIQIAPPLGQYDADRIVNLGSNRWTTRTEIGFAKAFAPLTLDMSAGATLFTDNDNYFNGQRREQEPIYSAQANLSYDFGNNIWAALGYTYYMGGRSTVNGVVRDDEIGNSRVGLTLALPLDRNFSVKLNVSRGIVTRIGTGFDIVGVALQYRWGAGL